MDKKEKEELKKRKRWRDKRFDKKERRVDIITKSDSNCKAMRKFVDRALGAKTINVTITDFLLTH